MSELLEQAVRRLRTLPDRRQDQIGQWLLDVLEQDETTVQLTPAQIAEGTRRMERAEPPLTEAEEAALFSKLA